MCGVDGRQYVRSGCVVCVQLLDSHARYPYWNLVGMELWDLCEFESCFVWGYRQVIVIWDSCIVDACCMVGFEITTRLLQLVPGGSGHTCGRKRIHDRRCGSGLKLLLT